MSGVRGNVVVVESATAYERLTQLPGAIDGWFDPAEAIGEVTFASVAQAQEAYQDAG